MDYMGDYNEDIDVDELILLVEKVTRDIKLLAIKMELDRMNRMLEELVESW